MGAWDTLRNIVNYVRTRWRPTNPDSYHQYRAGRERERKQGEQRREDAERSSEREREGAERKREYEERYTAERAAEEPRTPRRATGRDEEAEMAKHQNLAEWQGKDLVDQDGHRIGKLEDVYVDVETDEPMFGTVKEGLFARHLTFVPLRGITIGPDNLQVPVSRDQVQDAPNIDMHGDELSQDGESALYHHYQLNYTPPNTESGRRLARR